MTDITALSHRLSQLEAINAIKALKYRYLNACDEKRPDDVLQCFTPGQVDIDFGHIGQFSTPQDFVAVFKELGCHDHIVDMHHAQNPLIELHSDSHASAKICLRFMSINTRDKTRVQLGGHYLDDYRLVDGNWLISKSLFIVNAVEIVDFSGAQAVISYAGNCMPGQ